MGAAEVDVVKIVPAFDANRGVWYVEQPKNIKHTASTLRELRTKIGGKVTIAGYYPNGFSVQAARSLITRSAERGTYQKKAFDRIALSFAVADLHAKLKDEGKVL